MGIIAIGKDKHVGMACPANAYGAAGKMYGLTISACKPCSRNLVTDGVSRANGSEACVNDDGWGYNSDGASRVSHTLTYLSAGQLSGELFQHVHCVSFA